MSHTQIIVHISGESGTGKSTLGEELQKLFCNDVFVYDTDFLYNNTDLLTKCENTTREEYLIFYKETFQKSIEKFNKDNSDKIIIYVGLLDHMSIYNVYNEIKTKYKFYYTVDISILLQRFYSRLAYTLHKYIKDVVDDKYPIPSSSEIIKRSIETKKIHINMGYEPLNREEIIEKLKTLISYNKH